MPHDNSPIAEPGWEPPVTPADPDDRPPAGAYYDAKVARFRTRLGSFAGKTFDAKWFKRAGEFPLYQPAPETAVAAEEVEVMPGPEPERAAAVDHEIRRDRLAPERQRNVETIAAVLSDAGEARGVHDSIDHGEARELDAVTADTAELEHRIVAAMPDMMSADGRIAMDFKTKGERLAQMYGVDHVGTIGEADHPKDHNPKTAAGRAKPAMEFVPPVPLMHLAAVMRGGAEKYGPFNWRDSPVSETTYYSAAHRHLAAWFDGETYDPDSGQHQLAHVMACCAIIMDATACNSIHHDRPTPGPAAEVMRNLAEIERQRHK